MNIHDPAHIRSCSLCGARAARAAVQTFLRSLSEGKKGMGESESQRATLEAELTRLKGRIRELEAQVGATGHDNVTDHRSEAELVMDRAEERASRESAGRPRRDNSKAAIAIFRDNAKTRKGAGEFGQ